MCLLIYLGSIILLANFGHCDLTWDKVYGLLSAKLDKIILDQDLMKQEMKDLVTSTSQQVISLEKKLSEVSTLSQQMVDFQERLDHMDSHVTNFAMAEVGRTHLLRRGLEQEKAATQSRLNSVQQIQAGIQSDISVLMRATDDFRAQISDVEEKIKSTMNQTAEILSRNEDKMSTHLNKTRVLISYLEQEMVDTVGRFETLEKTQSDIKEAANKTQARIATMEQKVTATQSNTNTLQSRVQSIEETQEDLKSKTGAIESQVNATQGQIVVRIETLEKTQSDMKEAANKAHTQIVTVEQKVTATQSNTNTLQSRVQRLEETQEDLTLKTMSIESQVNTTRGQIVVRIETLEKTQSDMKREANKAQTQIATLEQKEAAKQSNFDVFSFELRVLNLEWTQDDLKSKTSDLKSKTSNIESQIGTTQGQISRLQNFVGTFVGFSAFLMTKKDYYDKNTVIIFDEVIYNQGSHYSTSTGIFTVPVSGVYIFTFNVEVDCNFVDTNIVAHVLLRINSEIKSQAAVRGYGYHLSSGNTAVLNVRYGDKVYVYTSNQYERHKIFPQRTTFSGALLHAN